MIRYLQMTLVRRDLACIVGMTGIHCLGSIDFGFVLVYSLFVHLNQDLRLYKLHKDYFVTGSAKLKMP